MSAFSVVRLLLADDHLVVRPIAKPRSGWEDAFRRIHEQGDVALLDEESLPPTQWDKTEGEW